MSVHFIGQRFRVSRGGCWQCLPDCRSRLSRGAEVSQVAYNGLRLDDGPASQPNRTTMTDQTTDNVSPEHGGAIDKPAVLGSASPVLRHSGEEGDGYDPDEWVDDMDYGDEFLGYQCLGCGHTQARNGWGGRCDRCDGLSLEEMYG